MSADFNPATLTSLEIRDLSLGYPGNMLLEKESFRIPGGSLTALLGRNGAGKSTMLKGIAGLGNVKEGDIFICGPDSEKRIREISSAELARLVSFVGTSRVRVNDMTLRQGVAMGRAPYTNWIGSLGREDWEIVDDAIAKVGMTAFAERKLQSLSDGECQRAMVARALAQQTPIMLLDEPTSFLDLPGRHSIVSLLSKLSREEGKTILFSTHELDIALEYCDNILLLTPPTATLTPASELDTPSILSRF